MAWMEKQDSMKLLQTQQENLPHLSQTVMRELHIFVQAFEDLALPRF